MAILSTRDSYVLSKSLSHADDDAFNALLSACRRKDKEGHAIQLDLANLPEIDADGLEMLHRARSTARVAGNALVIIASHPNIHALLCEEGLLSPLPETLAPTPDRLEPARIAPSASPLSTTMALGLQIAEHESALEIALSGRFTFACHDAFLPVLDQIGRSTRPEVILDCSALTFMDSAALSMVLIASDEASKCQARLVIRGASGRVRKLLDLSDIASLVELRDE